MLTLNVCDKCGSPNLRKSRIRSLFGWIISFAIVPWRCRICDHRQMKFKFVTVESTREQGAGECVDKPEA